MIKEKKSEIIRIWIKSKTSKHNKKIEHAKFLNILFYMKKS
jgi:hypothetical protein